MGMGMRWGVAAGAIVLLASGCLRPGFGDPAGGPGTTPTATPSPTPEPLPESDSPPPGSLGLATRAGGLVLEWVDAPAALEYRVYYAGTTGVDKTDYTTGIAGAVSPLALRDLPPTAVFVVVTAVYDDGESAISAELTGTPLSAGLLPDVAFDTSATGINGEELGVSLAGIDGNGDEFGDFVVSAWLRNAGNTDEGAAWGYEGSVAGLATTETWQELGNGDNRRLGSSIANAGDVDGDGYDDVIVGADGWSNNEDQEGSAWMWPGTPTFLSDTSSWNVESGQANARMGSAVAGVGDINADGFDDVVVGADDWDGGQQDEGRVYLYLGSAGGLSNTPDWTDESNVAGANMGRSVAAAGDVNGDGFDDVLVGIPDYNGGQQDEGRVHVYYGSAQGLAATPDWFMESNQADARFGSSVAGGEDVNGDGFDDILIGARGLDDGEQDEGGVFAYYGSAQGLPASPDWQWQSNQADARGGAAVHLADFNGDGYADAVVGVPDFDDGEADEGVIELFYGGANGLSPASVARRQEDVATAEYGAALGSSDVNGDGSQDLLVGWPGRGGGEGGWLFYFSPLGQGPVVHAGDPVSNPDPNAIRMSAGAINDVPQASSHSCDIDWGDGQSDQQDPCDTSDLDNGQTHDYPGNGTYWITVTVTNDLGLVGQAAVRVEIGQ